MFWKNGVKTCPADEFSPICEKARSSVAYKLCVCTTVKVLCSGKFRLFYCRWSLKSNQQKQGSISRPVIRILSVNARRTTANGQTERETRLYTQPNDTLLYPIGATRHVKDRQKTVVRISNVVTPQSCPRKWGKWTERIFEETSFLFWFFLKLGRRAHHDRFFPKFGIILAQTSARQQLFKVSNIRNGIHLASNQAQR